MGIKWDAVLEAEKRRFERMSEHDRFVFFLLSQFGSPYGWGKETPESSGCSGAACMALYAATGLLIRTTADDLLKRVFTKLNPRSGEIRAVFFVTKHDKKHGDGGFPAGSTAAAGTATHVAGILEDGIILNSQEPGAKVRRASDVSDWYMRAGHEALVRGLDREALERLAKDVKNRQGLDADFGKYFEVGF